MTYANLKTTRIFSVVLIGATALVAGWVSVQSAFAQDPFPPPVISGNLPLSVDIPSSFKPAPDLPPHVGFRPFFDIFSWQSFIALNWPADPTARGTPQNPDDPSVFMNASQGTKTVWESYKESFQLFGTGNQAPNAWNDPDVLGNPCSNAGGAKQLNMVGKGDDVLDEVNEAFSHPLIDQNLNYVYAEVRFNDWYYNFVRDNGYYLKKNLPFPQTAMQMPISDPTTGQIGTIMIKAAWRIMTDNDELDRYHWVEAAVMDPKTKDCVPQKVGLVGLHIAQKVDTFPEWIWTSFEQVDNVERGHGATDSTPISFNNGTDTPATPNGWANRPPKVPPLLDMDQREAVQVTRVNEIPTSPPDFSTVDLNAQYQALLKGTPWEFYQLIITQWPTKGEQFKLMQDGGTYPDWSGDAFPVYGATNTAMETFLQSQTDATGAGGNSCMQCHYGAGPTDFSWILQNDSHSTTD